MNKTRLIKVISISIMAIILLALPFMVRNYPFVLHLIIMTGIFSIIGTGLRFIHTANVWFVGPSAFYAMGAYGIALLMGMIGLSFWACIPLIGIGVVIFAWGFGSVTLRVKGIYFAILSLALVEVIRLTLVNTLGSHRLLLVSPPNAISIPHLFRIDFVTKVDYYYLVLVALAITLIILYRIEKSQIGVILKAIAQDETLAESLGIKVVRYKVLALCVCAFFGAIAGICFAPYNETISPESFTVWASMLILIQMVVGGMGSLWGPVIGAAILTILPEVLYITPFVQKITYACLVILVLYFLPGGIMSLPQVIQGKTGRRRTLGQLKA